MKQFNFLFKGWLMAVLISLTNLSIAQVATQYTFSQSAGTYTPITGGNAIFSGTFDDAVTNVSIPSFYFDGNFYNSVNVSTNGFITFGATAPGNTIYTPLSSTTAYAGAISGFGRDLQQGASGAPEIRYEQVGNELVFQFKDVRRWGQTELFSFQIRLNLSNAEIRVVYDVPALVGTSTTYPQVGLRGPSNAFATNVNNRSVVAATGDWINSVPGTVNTSTCYFNNANPATVPSAGLTYTWTPVSLPTDDAVLSAITSPLSGCSLSASEQVTVSVSNLGFSTINSVDLSYQINGGAIITETAAISIPTGGSAIYTFTAPADLSATGVYSFKAWTGLVGDVNNNNDTVQNYLVEHFVPVMAPVSEDFETFTTATNATGFANGWTTNPSATTTAFRWNVQTGATPTANTGPSGDHTSGSGKYIFTESSSGATGAVAIVESPCIDLNTLTLPGVSFWYHMYGTNTGKLFVDVRTGSNWVALDSIVGQVQTATTDAWIQKVVDLSAYAGQIIKIRFRGERGSSTTGDMAIDDISVTEFAIPDLSATAIENPVSNCALSSTESVTISVLNSGLVPITGFDASYRVNGGAVITETSSQTIAPGNTASYTFTATADLSATGIYSLDTWVKTTGDNNANNDSIIGIQVEHFVPIATPYTEDFETFTTATNATGYANGWSTNPAATTTAFRWNVQTGGTPTTNTGPSADHTSGSGKYIFTESTSGATGAVAVVESPCIDLSGLTNPGLEFWYHKFGVNMGNLYVDINSSGVWSTVDSVIGQTQTSNGAAWLKKLVDLGSYSSQIIKVRFRAVRGSSTTGDMAIDDINIADFSNPDLAAGVIVSPVTSCGLTSTETVEVTYTNLGLVPVSSFNVGYIFNNGAPVVEAVSTTLNPGATYTHSFAATIDLSLQGIYSLKVFSDIANDSDLNNDTLVSSIENIPTISGFPQIQDFELNDGGWVPAGATMNWEWGTPSNTVISSANGCGNNAWVTGLTTDYPALSGAVGYLVSPCFDLSSSATDPKIRFDQILDLESCCDETWVEYSLDAGQNWTKLGTSGTGVNWYNDATNQWWDLATTNGWRFVENTIPGSAGNDQVRVRFAFSSDASVQNEGVGIDNLMIFEELVEASPVGFSSPQSSCSMTSAEVLTAEIRNNGSDTIFTIQACYSINGGAFVCETINDTLLAGQVFSYDFAATGDFSVPGNYDLTLAVSLAGDVNGCNDTVITTITSIPTVSSFPLIEDFESDNGFFVASGTNSNWEWGTPANSVINSSNGCGNNAWVTGLTSDYNNSAVAYLNSPCLDLSGVSTDPKIRFDQILDLESCCDETWIESSIDGGATWNKIGVSGTGVNWFNDAGNQWWDLASTNGWRQVENTLTGLAGQSAVLLRLVFSSDGSISNEGVGFDNLMIFEDLVDAQPATLSSPVSDCGLTNAELVEASFRNNGTDSIFSLNVCYIVNGGTPVCEVLNDTILPGASYNYTFATPVDLSAAATYTIQIVSSLAGDMNSCSDTLATTVTNKPLITSYPYFEDFENGQGGWEATGGSWAFGTPAKSVITGAGSGVNAWVTGGLGTGLYGNNESSSVQSPCFDFTTLPANPWVALKVWWNSENSWDGAALQMSRDNGSNWTTIGAFAPATQNFPYNWYNDNSIGANPGGQVLGWTGTGPGQWIQASHPLDTTGFGNATNVVFRVAFASDGSINYDGIAFDDFAIGTLPALSLADTTVCGGYAMPSGYTSGVFTWESQNITTLDQNVIGNGSSVTLNNPGSVDSTLNVLLTFTDEYGFTNFDTALVTLHPAPLSDFGPDTAICYNDTLALFADTGSGYTYAWNTGSIQDSILVTSAGNYFVIVTDNVTGCSHQEDIFVHITPALNLAATAAVCDGDSVLLDVGPQYFTFNWSTGENTQGIYASSAGTYLVNVTDSIGCASTDSIDVIVNPLPSVSLGGDQTICTYTSTTLDAGPGFSAYLWSNLANTQTINVNGAALGAGSYTYSVRVTDGNGCQDTDTITVIVDPCVSVDEITQSDEFTILPNPNNGQFAIDLGQISGDVIVEVLSADGKLVSTEQLFSAGGRRNFEMSQLERGVYFVRISHSNGVSVMRMVVQK